MTRGDHDAMTTATLEAPTDEDRIARRNALAEEHRPLVYLIAKKFAGSGIDRHELISAGQFALLRACEEFNPGLGYAPGTLLGTFIFNAMRNLIRRPKSKAWRPQVSCEVELALAEDHRPGPLAGAVESEEAAIARRLLGTLTGREREVVEASVLAGRTYEAIGRDLGITKERVRQIRGKAIEKMRDYAPAGMA